MAAAITDKLRRAAPAFSTTLAADKAQAAGVMTLQSAAGVPTTTAIDFTVGRVDANGNKTPALKAVYTGLLSGTTVSSLSLVEGTDQLHKAGTPVEITFTAATHNSMVDWGLTHANQDGTLATGSVSTAALAAGSVTQAKLSTSTGEIGAAWRSFSSGVTAGSGTITNATCTGNYVQIGKFVSFRAVLTIINAGTGAGVAIFTLPVASLIGTTGTSIGTGRESAASGKAICVILQSTTTAGLLMYDNTTPVVTGNTLQISGTYEAA